MVDFNCFIIHIPTNIIILGSPSRIGAGLFSIIILFEIVIGSVSAAILTDELFGWREGLGCSLIILAGLSEIISPGIKSKS
jgi:drug/metabolite transporter (DMT)-like permease